MFYFTSWVAGAQLDCAAIAGKAETERPSAARRGKRPNVPQEWGFLRLFARRRPPANSDG